MLQVEHIANKDYRRIVDTMPILCVDIVLRGGDGRYLLVKRNNEPLKGHWWVPGGRVYKGESLEQAAIRKAREELSLEISSPKLLGYHEYFLDRYHSVAFVFTETIDFTTALYDDMDGLYFKGESSGWRLFPDLPRGFDIMPFGEVGR